MRVADEVVSKVIGAGGRVVVDLGGVLDAGRMAGFTDPEGFAFCVWHARQHQASRFGRHDLSG